MTPNDRQSGFVLSGAALVHVSSISVRSETVVPAPLAWAAYEILRNASKVLSKAVMIHSIFILNSAGEVIIEKHYRGNNSRTESAAFWTQTAKSAKGVPTDVPPFLPTPKGALIHLHRNGLFFLASVLSDTQPLFVTQFLESLADVFVDYFGELNEHAIKDNFITVYELLDEMLDNGFPLTVEANTLKELITPPSMLNRVFEQLGADTGKATATMTYASPHTPWRRANVRYAQNEIFVDVVETVHATYSATRHSLSHTMISGTVTVNCRLSGNPDLNMRISSHGNFDDVAMHHCVRLGRYLENRQISFIPPDGPFTLMTYKVREANAIKLPVDVHPKIEFDHAAGTGSVTVTVLPRFVPNVAAPAPPSSATAAGSLMLAQVMSAAGGKAMGIGSNEPESIMDNVSVEIPFGEGVTGASLSANYGTVQFESLTGVCVWNIGAVYRGKTPSLKGNISLHKESIARIANPQILLAFRIPGFSSSGVSVESLDLMPPENYKYYKGLRCTTKAGLYEIRT